ncbi:MAG: hypothetical protein AB2L11_06615 [Syntrophobacteraceae bacterium]
MSKRLYTAFTSVLLACVIVACVFWQRQNISRWLPGFFKTPSEQSSPRVPVSEAEREANAGLVASSDTDHTTITGEGAETESSSEQSNTLPPSPPLPGISPESNQQERRNTLQLKESVDYIVTKDEPFEAGGKQLRIADLLGLFHESKDAPSIFPSIQEKEIGSKVRHSILPSTSASSPSNLSYYGVRIVRDADNVWHIHYAIIREYFARRGILLAKDCDRPLQDGRSSGVARLLKFIEAIVYVYNVNENRFEKDLNFIYPQFVIVFFKISDFFAALDNLRAEDLSSVYYVKDNLRLERKDKQCDLLDRRLLRE